MIDLVGFLILAVLVASSFVAGYGVARIRPAKPKRDKSGRFIK